MYSVQYIIELGTSARLKFYEDDVLSSVGAIFCRLFFRHLPTVKHHCSDVNKYFLAKKYKAKDLISKAKATTFKATNYRRRQHLLLIPTTALHYPNADAMKNVSIPKNV